MHAEKEEKNCLEDFVFSVEEFLTASSRDTIRSFFSIDVACKICFRYLSMTRSLKYFPILFHFVHFLNVKK